MPEAPSGGPSPEKNTEVELTKEIALRAIEVIKQQVYRTGRVDSEPNQFEAIVALLQDEKITPKEAILKANEIWDTRQDYN